MAHTDVHQPHWVKQQMPEWKHLFVEDHDHSAGPCTLAEWKATQPRLRDWRGCHLREVNIGTNPNCGCRMCTGQGGRKYRRRRERAAWRADRQSLLHGGSERPTRNLETWF